MTDTLLALARRQAEQQHLLSVGHGLHEGHEGAFETCPHPTCRLAREPQGWQPIATAPQEGRFLVYASNCSYLMVMDGRMLSMSRWPHTPQHLSGSHWTHWIALPDPPAAAQETT